MSASVASSQSVSVPAPLPPVASVQLPLQAEEAEVISPLPIPSRPFIGNELHGDQVLTQLFEANMTDETHAFKDPSTLPAILEPTPLSHKNMESLFSTNLIFPIEFHVFKRSYHELLNFLNRTHIKLTGVPLRLALLAGSGCPRLLGTVWLTSDLCACLPGLNRLFSHYRDDHVERHISDLDTHIYTAEVPDIENRLFDALMQDLISELHRDITFRIKLRRAGSSALSEIVITQLKELMHYVSQLPSEVTIVKILTKVVPWRQEMELHNPRLSNFLKDLSALALIAEGDFEENLNQFACQYLFEKDIEEMKSSLYNRALQNHGIHFRPSLLEGKNDILEARIRFCCKDTQGNTHDINIIRILNKPSYRIESENIKIDLTGILVQKPFEIISAHQAILDKYSKVIRWPNVENAIAADWTHFWRHITHDYRNVLPNTEQVLLQKFLAGCKKKYAKNLLSFVKMESGFNQSQDLSETIALAFNCSAALLQSSFPKKELTVFWQKLLGLFKKKEKDFLPPSSARDPLRILFQICCQEDFALVYAHLQIRAFAWLRLSSRTREDKKIGIKLTQSAGKPIIHLQVGEYTLQFPFDPVPSLNMLAKSLALQSAAEFDKLIPYPGLGVAEDRDFPLERSDLLSIDPEELVNATLSFLKHPHHYFIAFDMVFTVLQMPATPKVLLKIIKMMKIFKIKMETINLNPFLRKIRANLAQHVPSLAKKASTSTKPRPPEIEPLVQGLAELPDSDLNNCALEMWLLDVLPIQIQKKAGLDLLQKFLKRKSVISIQMVKELFAKGFLTVKAAIKKLPDLCRVLLSKPRETQLQELNKWMELASLVSAKDGEITRQALFDLLAQLTKSKDNLTSFLFIYRGLVLNQLIQDETLRFLDRLILLCEKATSFDLKIIEDAFQLLQQDYLKDPLSPAGKLKYVLFIKLYQYLLKIFPSQKESFQGLYIEFMKKHGPSEQKKQHAQIKKEAWYGLEHPKDLASLTIDIQKLLELLNGEQSQEILLFQTQVLLALKSFILVKTPPSQLKMICQIILLPKMDERFTSDPESLIELMSLCCPHLEKQSSNDWDFLVGKFLIQFFELEKKDFTETIPFARLLIKYANLLSDPTLALTCQTHSLLFLETLAPQPDRHALLCKLFLALEKHQAAPLFLSCPSSLLLDLLNVFLRYHKEDLRLVLRNYADLFLKALGPVQETFRPPIEQAQKLFELLVEEKKVPSSFIRLAFNLMPLFPNLDDRFWLESLKAAYLCGEKPLQILAWNTTDGRQREAEKETQDARFNYDKWRIKILFNISRDDPANWSPTIKILFQSCQSDHKRLALFLRVCLKEAKQAHFSLTELQAIRKDLESYLLQDENKKLRVTIDLSLAKLLLQAGVEEAFLNIMEELHPLLGKNDLKNWTSAEIAVYFQVFQNLCRRQNPKDLERAKKLYNLLENTQVVDVKKLLELELLLLTTELKVIPAGATPPERINTILTSSKVSMKRRLELLSALLDFQLQIFTVETPFGQIALHTWEYLRSIETTYCEQGTDFLGKSLSLNGEGKKFRLEVNYNTSSKTLILFNPAYLLNSLINSHLHYIFLNLKSKTSKTVLRIDTLQTQVKKLINPANNTFPSFSLLRQTELCHSSYLLVEKLLALRPRTPWARAMMMAVVFLHLQFLFKEKQGHSEELKKVFLLFDQFFLHPMLTQEYLNIHFLQLHLANQFLPENYRLLRPSLYIQHQMISTRIEISVDQLDSVEELITRLIKIPLTHTFLQAHFYTVIFIPQLQGNKKPFDWYNQILDSYELLEDNSLKCDILCKIINRHKTSLNNVKIPFPIWKRLFEFIVQLIYDNTSAHQKYHLIDASCELLGHFYVFEKNIDHDVRELIIQQIKLINPFALNWSRQKLSLSPSLPIQKHFSSLYEHTGYLSLLFINFAVFTEECPEHWISLVEASKQFLERVKKTQEKFEHKDFDSFVELILFFIDSGITNNFFIGNYDKILSYVIYLIQFIETTRPNNLITNNTVKLLFSSLNDENESYYPKNLRERQRRAQAMTRFCALIVKSDNQQLVSLCYSLFNEKLNPNVYKNFPQLQEQAEKSLKSSLFRAACSLGIGSFIMLHTLREEQNSKQEQPKGE